MNRQISIDEEFWQQECGGQEHLVNKENSFESCSTFYSTAENIEVFTTHFAEKNMIVSKCSSV